MKAACQLLSQRFAVADLPATVRRMAGQPLRRASLLTQLAACGALHLLTDESRAWPTALLWQSTRGPRQETENLLAEMHQGGEPMPYDFLATQPAITGAQLQPLLPGLCAAHYVPLPTTSVADWQMLLALALARLADGSCRQVLCAHLDIADDWCTGHWLLLAGALENPQGHLQIVGNSVAPSCPDRPDLPLRLADHPQVSLESARGWRQTLEFTRSSLHR